MRRWPLPPISSILLILFALINLPAGAATINIAKPGTGSGVVTSNPPGINCGTVCGADLAGPVTLTATPDAYSTFGGWMGACAGQNEVCALPPGTSNQTVAAYFQGAAIRGTSDETTILLLKSCGTLGWAYSNGSFRTELTNVSNFPSWGNGGWWAVKRDGTVWSYGTRVDGSHSYFWTQEPALGNDVIDMDVGDTQGLALKRDGTVWVWGTNFLGEMGNGTVDNPLEETGVHPPAPVPGLSNVIAIAARGGSHPLALKSDGTVWAWGRNTDGKVGKSPATGILCNFLDVCQPVPVQVGLSNVISINGSYADALASDGTVWWWGNAFPTLSLDVRNTVCARIPIDYGSGETVDWEIRGCFPTPSPVPGLSNNVIAIGKGYFTALDGDGRVWWLSGSTLPQSLSNMSGLSDVFAFDGVFEGAGGGFVAIKRDGTIWRGYDNQQLVRFSNINAHDDCGAGSPVLTVTKTGAGAGRVTSNPAGIDCGETCQAPFAVGTLVTLTAAPEAGSGFGGWRDCTPLQENPLQCTVSMDVLDHEVIATFNVNPATTLIVHYYTNILGRGPDAGGLAYWQQLIAQKQAQGLDVKPVFRDMAHFFFNSPEYLANNTSDTEFLHNLYRTFFQREPDAGGLEFWLNQLALGVSRNQVMSGFLYSPEFTAFMQGLGF